MDFEELTNISTLIKSAEERLTKECWKSFDDGYLKWDHKLKRILLSFDGLEKPLIEWKVEVRVDGFKKLSKFIKSCIEAQQVDLGIDKAKEELEGMLYNQ